jgi:hypothetical protein
MFVDNNINNYVHIYFCNFLKHGNITLFFNMKGLLELGSQKYFPQKKIKKNVYRGGFQDKPF